VEPPDEPATLESASAGEETDGRSGLYKGTFTRSDLEVDSRTWTSCIVGKVGHNV
jgi:hypothetical protein